MTPGVAARRRRAGRAPAAGVLGARNARRRDPAVPGRAHDAWLPEHVELSGRVYPGLTHSVSEQELDDVRVFLEKQLEQLD